MQKAESNGHCPSTAMVRCLFLNLDFVCDRWDDRDRAGPVKFYEKSQESRATDHDGRTNDDDSTHRFTIKAT
jgi:hypothetical protein